MYHHCEVTLGCLVFDSCLGEAIEGVVHFSKKLLLIIYSPPFVE